LFQGNTGSGKTHLACAIANELIDKGHTVKFIPVTELLDKIKATFDAQYESEDGFIKPLRDCDLLILDDLGAERTTSWTMAKLHNLIDYRYSNYKPTIITTNLLSGELSSVLDTRTVDRILDVHKERFTILNLAVDSYRKQR